MSTDNPVIIAEVTRRDLSGTPTSGHTIVSVPRPSVIAMTTRYYEKAVNAATQVTIEAEHDEIATAITALLAISTAHCPAVTQIILTDSDQGDWLTFDSVTCPTHATKCPAQTALSTGDTEDFASHIYTGHLAYAREELHLTDGPAPHTYAIDTTHVAELTATY